MVCKSFARRTPQNGSFFLNRFGKKRAFSVFDWQNGSGRVFLKTRAGFLTDGNPPGFKMAPYSFFRLCLSVRARRERFDGGPVGWSGSQIFSPSGVQSPQRDEERACGLSKIFTRTEGKRLECGTDAFPGFYRAGKKESDRMGSIFIKDAVGKQTTVRKRAIQARLADGRPESGERWRFRVRAGERLVPAIRPGWNRALSDDWDTDRTKGRRRWTR